MQSLKILQVSAVRMMQRESQYHIFRCACTGRHSIDDPLPGMTSTEITQVISLTWLVEFRIAKKSQPGAHAVHQICLVQKLIMSNIIK